jgi:poly(hydroxyalkanoate) depolymerase family esterase
MVATNTARRLWASRFLAALAVLAVLAFQLVLIRPVYAAAATFVQYTYSGAAGSRPYYVYTPAGYTPTQPAPLIVMLHGCTQNPVDFSRGTQMNTFADSKQFIVVYPWQTTAYQSIGCWHWDQAAHQSRGSGEPSIIAGITRTVMADSAHWNIDSTRVYVAGLSAGAAMSVVMGATYPDVYAAMGEAAGLEYKAVTNGNDGPAQQFGGPDPVTQGKAAYAAMGSAARLLPVIVFQGLSDTTIYPINGDQVVQQWMQTDMMASASYSAAFASPTVTTTGQVPGASGHPYKFRQWNDQAANEVEEYWTVTGMGHAWSGGSTTGSFADPNGPSATQNMYAFFMAHPSSPPAPPTTVPAAPTGLTAAAASATQTSLSWAGSAGAASYQVQRSPDGTLGWSQAGSTAITTYTDAGLTAGTPYYYRVAAVNVIGPSAPSNVASVATNLSVSQPPQGTWVSNYGAGGYALLAWNGTSGDLVSLPNATLTIDVGTRWTWRASSTLAQDLQSPDATSRRATCLFDNTQLKLHLTFASAYSGTLHLYALDGSTTARRQVVTVNDGTVPRTVNLNSSFNLGDWLSATINVPAGGTVTITANHNAGYNAVLSGLFLDP